MAADEVSVHGDPKWIVEKFCRQIITIL